VLSRRDIDAFAADGYLVLRGAVPARVIAACQQVIWSQLAAQGVLPDDPATWAAPVVRIDCPEGGPFAEAGTTPAVQEACDQLIGTGRWWRRDGIGGTIPVRFPSEADPGDAGWHIESSFEASSGGSSGGAAQWRVNVASRARGLLALYLLTDVSQDSAPTLVRPGSHTDVPSLLAPYGDDGLEATQAGQLADRASAHRPTALATGRAGDVFLCHPFLVHAASWPHRGRSPRMIAQPAVALHSQYPLGAVPGEPVSPVEQTIIDSLTHAGLTGNQPPP
jgi:hypothetical protein